MQNNDFSEVLLEHIKGIQDKIPSKLGYLAEKEGLVLYPLPGGEVVDEDMAGTQTVRLPFEIAIKSRDRFRAVLFRMVPKPVPSPSINRRCFRAVLFRMVPKPKA